MGMKTWSCILVTNSRAQRVIPVQKRVTIDQLLSENAWLITIDYVEITGSIFAPITAGHGPTTSQYNNVSLGTHGLPFSWLIRQLAMLYVRMTDKLARWLNTCGMPRGCALTLTPKSRASLHIHPHFPLKVPLPPCWISRWDYFQIKFNNEKTET